jgi:hypothetical protein
VRHGADRPQHVLLMVPFLMQRRLMGCVDGRRLGPRRMNGWRLRMPHRVRDGRLRRWCHDVAVST